MVGRMIARTLSEIQGRSGVWGTSVQDGVDGVGKVVVEFAAIVMLLSPN